MALIIFPPDDLEPELAALLHPDLRKDVADKVNKAILASQGQSRNAAIRNLVRLRAWAEDEARSDKKRGVALPPQLDIGLDADMQMRDASNEHENGNEPMIT
jgi:hypothetical protein